MEIKNIECCLKCAEIVDKGTLKTHICYANLKQEVKQEKTEIKEILKKGVKNVKE